MYPYLTFLDVGQGDSIIIGVHPGMVVLVDLPAPRKMLDWLSTRDVNYIERIYFSHAHRDHLPSFRALKTFLINWMATRRIGRVILPAEAIRNALVLPDDSAASNTQRREAEDALQWMIQWHKEGRLEFCRSEDGLAHLAHGDVTIAVLHPSFLFFETHNYRHPKKANETSSVIRVEYGEFRALLLGDVDGAGISDVLDRYDDDQLRSSVVKIPHHGAWPKDSLPLEQLIEKVDPEFTVISVGSANPYGHVSPKLFKLLLSQKDSPTARCCGFACTELTRTCMYSALDRAVMGMQGLSKAYPCGGNLTIMPHKDGTWRREGEDAHASYVATLRYPACLGRADLGL